METCIRRQSVARNALFCYSRTVGGRPGSLYSALSQSRASSNTSFRRQQFDAFPSQLENAANASFIPSEKSVVTPQTITEKIVQRHAVGLAPGKKVRQGDFVTLRPKCIMTHDNGWPVLKKFTEIGASKIHDSRQVVMTLDHDVSNESESNLTKYRLLEEFAHKHGCFFSGKGQGIGHQRVIEEGFSWPGAVTVASDSHSNMYGAVGSLGTPVVRSDAASIWATGTTWWQVPPVIKVNLTGVLPIGVSGKDIIVALCGLFNKDEALNHCIEFAGSEQTLASIPVDDRLCVSNMTTEWGALSGLFPVDDVLISWYRAKASTAAMLNSSTKERINHERIDKLLENRLTADSGAIYAKELYLNLSTLSPMVAGPNSVRIITPITKLEAEGIAINKCFLISCTNARASDIRRAARVFLEAGADGKAAKVASGVKFYLAAASLAEQRTAEEAGDWQILLDAGAQPLISGCGPCIGLGPGILEDGETCISSSNRNFKGRMGSTAALAYLASPEIVAASAIRGKIAGPGWYQKPEGVEKVIIGEGSGDHIVDQTRSFENAFDKLINDIEGMVAAAEGAEGAEGAEDATEQQSQPSASNEETLTEILPGFPDMVEGEIIFCDNDNINTDGIYPGEYSQSCFLISPINKYKGKYTYQDVSREKMAGVCMENYDPEFQTIAKIGDILVSGFNFGCGSSREQAATAILAKQIPLVIAGSFSNIFSRNSINNALMSIEMPDLVRHLRETFKDDPAKPLTRRTGWKLLWDVRRSKVIVTKKDGSIWERKVGEVPPNVQEIAKAGLEQWVKERIKT
ncbi:mitochondrial Homoaconitase [Durotheca rogersii]|uniref:mitochondrial Homoaconitase n=1 Tax=Durotheca rogersii TaxID=419775 RepID=UPI002220FEA6|nr:mitochondrial Homoaconitase [Durotheca rogersii]KAI5866748.1 mitochondrial Homoaconitase [Durotheca rogersii]